jgi:hypothetical protein
MVIWHATQQPADRATEERMGQLAARWTRLFQRRPGARRMARTQGRGAATS